ncbi:MAG TPA: glycoside hydrolase family 15 protein [Planctomycetota bacterium]|jgi:glucoamylase|nr:glycoside hydrolase family 15 protein [Planctomycetota bacterium]
MAIVHTAARAFGVPGIAPRWTRGAKDAVGTAYSSGSTVWFTVSGGVVNEVYHPTIDRPQIRDLQYLVTDGESFFHDERRHLDSRLEEFENHALGARIINTDREGRYRIIKEVIADPHQPCILVRTWLEGEPRFLTRLRLFVLLAPHLDAGGWGNSGYVAEAAGRGLLTAQKHGTWLALGATIPFVRRSCGYVGTTDGWTDLADNFRMDWEFDVAENGNVALVGELDLRGGHEFTLGLSFGNSLHSATTELLQSLSFPFAEHRGRFVEQWARACRQLAPLAAASGDGGRLYHASHRLLLAHEDKTYPGAMIASLSIPWGEAKGDEDRGGYHLVWTRDMVHSATGLLASGNAETPLRALIYLACSQLSDGGFHQNFWIDGQPYWRGVQLDEVAFPILLAWKLREVHALRDFDPYPMVLRAAGYLIQHGPATPQERWEEHSGYSPSTLAVSIAALTCAASFARERGDEATAAFLQQHADFLECHVEAWTVTTDGTLVPGIVRHFIRIRPVDPYDPEPDEDPNRGVVTIRNRPPGEPAQFPANEIVDAGFLELVRYGIRKAGHPLIEDSLRVVDAILRVETPFGPCWRRYNHDGYGQRDDGGPYEGWGTGRAWPLLTGERGHYELAAGRDMEPYLRAMEGFSTAAGLLPEQVWDGPDRPEARLRLGGPTGAAMPLMWAHAEYIKLLRSAHDGQVFDRIPAVVERYQGRRRVPPIEVWAFSRRVRSVRPGTILRLQARAPFRVRWTAEEWSVVGDTASTSTALGISFADIPIARGQAAPIRFTFFWPEVERWEGRDFVIHVEGTP